MGVQSLYGERAAGSSDLLAIGFGTTVAMWAVGYVGHMPLTDVPPVVFVTLMLACLVAGGWVVGSKTRRGVAGGLGLGLIVALLNLMILGSTLRAQYRPDRAPGLALGAGLFCRQPGAGGRRRSRGHGLLLASLTCCTRRDGRGASGEDS